MQLFELLFVLLVLTALVTLLRALLLFVRGRRARAATALRRLALGAALYLAVVLLVSPLVPRRTVALGEPLCFDDWCLTVDAARRTAMEEGERCVVDLRLSCRARRVAQSERGVRVVLLDAGGVRHEPLADPAALPLDVRLAPGEERTTTRAFALTPGVPAAGLVVEHWGFPIRWLLIGQGPFRGEPLVRLDRPSGG